MFYDVFLSYFVPRVGDGFAPGNFYRRQSMTGNSRRREAPREEKDFLLSRFPPSCYFSLFRMEIRMRGKSFHTTLVIFVTERHNEVPDFYDNTQIRRVYCSDAYNIMESVIHNLYSKF